MTFPTLAGRVSSLKEILAGPILRRVTDSSVTVWVATKSAMSVQLEVYKGAERVLVSSASDTPGVKLGPNLSLACVTATGAPGTLTPGVLYEYELRLGPDGRTATSICGPDITFGVPGAPGRPSFYLPGATTSSLVLATGSCRKPHGPGLDALAVLDTAIEATLTEPDKRPQLLLLSGDQIYADDVAGALLHMILDAEESLIGSNEILPDIGSARAHKPTQRSRFASFTDSEGFFTSGHADSHLLSLSEYILMYIFVWSAELWPVVSGEVQLPTFTEATGQSGYATYPVQRPSGLREEKRKTPSAEQYQEELGRLERFSSSLPAVRRVLANVPTLMMFDDHEVTDDWYINRWWCKRVLGRAAGRRVLANGLTAFALCQAWGNTPDRFVPGQWGNELRRAVGTGSSSVAFGKLESMLLPNVDILESEGRLVTPIPAEEQWAFDVVFPAFHLVVLDTRTARGFPPAPEGNVARETEPPLIIDQEALARQLVPLERDVAVLLFPPPLLGSPIAEAYQLRRRKFERIEEDCEAPGLNAVFFEQFLSTLARAVPRGSEGGRGKVLVLSGDVHFASAARLRYSATRPYGAPLASLSPEQVDYVLVQLTSSACKNRAEGALFVAATQSFSPVVASALYDGLPELVGGHNDASTISNAVRRSLQERATVVAMELSRVRGSFEPLPPSGYVADLSNLSAPQLEELRPEWRYSLEFHRDVGGKIGAVAVNNLGTVTFEGDNVNFVVRGPLGQRVEFTSSLVLEEL